MKRKASTTIKGKMEKRRMEVTSTFNEIVDTIEKYFTIAPFEWFKDVDAEVGAKSFPKCRTEDMAFLHPSPSIGSASYYRRQLTFNAGSMTLAIRKTSPERWHLPLTNSVFICGVLVGSRYMGATREQLLKQSHAWTVPRLKWEEGRLADEAEKQARNIDS